VAKKRLDRFFKAFVGGLFLPAAFATTQRMSRLAQIVIGIGLTIPVVAALPWVRVYLSCHYLDLPADTEKEFLKNLCDFLAVLFQVLIAITVGGIAVTEAAVQAVRSRVSHLQDQQIQELKQRQNELLRRIIRLYLQIRSVRLAAAPAAPGVNPGAIRRDLTDLWRLLVGGEISNFYAFLLLIRTGAAFPAGFYGVIAFLLFEGLICSQVVKTYLDYAASCAAAPT
jgi:hypothetical protein